MIDHQNIDNGENGLSVRTKLNKMLSELITGDEGINQVWINIQEILDNCKNIDGGGAATKFEVNETLDETTTQ